MKTFPAMFCWAMEVETFPWYQWRWGEQKNIEPFLKGLCGIIYKSSSSPCCISRTFTAWFMLRPYACASPERRFAVRLETRERWVFQLGTWWRETPDLEQYFIFLTVCDVASPIERNLVHCEDTSWDTGLEGYKLYPKTLKIWRPHG